MSNIQNIQTYSDNFHLKTTNCIESYIMPFDSWDITNPDKPVLHKHIIADIRNKIQTLGKFMLSSIRLTNSEEIIAHFTKLILSTSEFVDIINDFHCDNLENSEDAPLFVSLPTDEVTSANNGQILSPFNISVISSQFDSIFFAYMDGLTALLARSNALSTISNFSTNSQGFNLDGKRKGPFAALLAHLKEAAKSVPLNESLELSLYVHFHQYTVRNNLHTLSEEILQTVHSSDLENILKMLGLSLDGSSLSPSKFPVISTLLKPVIGRRGGGAKGVLNFIADPSAVSTFTAKYPMKGSTLPFINLAFRTIYSPPSVALPANSYTVVYNMLNPSIAIVCKHMDCPPSEEFRVRIAQWIIAYTAFQHASSTAKETLLTRFINATHSPEDNEYFYDPLDSHVPNAHASNSVLGRQLHTHIPDQTPEDAEGYSPARTSTSSTSAATSGATQSKSKTSKSSPSRNSKATRSSSFDSSRSAFHERFNINALTNNIGHHQSDEYLTRINNVAKTKTFILNPHYKDTSVIVTPAELAASSGYKAQHDDTSVSKNFACFSDDGKGNSPCILHGYSTHTTPTCFAICSDAAVTNRPYIPDDE
jgi:hypothetical protein